MLRKIILLAVLLCMTKIASGQLLLTDSIKRIKGIDYKISYAVNKTKDTLKVVYFSNTKTYEDKIISVPPMCTAITGFQKLAVVNKIQSTTAKGIIDELKKQNISFDEAKIKEAK